MPAQTRVAVVGAGAFGQNHLRVYNSIASAHLVAFVEPDPTLRTRLAAEYPAAKAFASLEHLLASDTDFDAASICVPTIHHASAAIALLQAGKDVLIEKPIASTLAEADAIIAAASDNQIVQVGHLERFNPAVTAAIPLLNRPMFFEAHRLSVFTPRSLDVDVVLDLMIHDLDVVLSLVPSPVAEVRAVGLPVLSQKTDIANVRVEFGNGCVANFTASRVSTERVRKLRFFQPHQYLSLDFARQDLLLIDVTAAASLNPAQLQALFAAQSQSSSSSATTGDHPSTGLGLRKIPTEPGEPLRLELESFLHAIQTRTAPLVTAPAARAALALALQINTEIAAHQHRAGL